MLNESGPWENYSWGRRRLNKALLPELAPRCYSSPLCHMAQKESAFPGAEDLGMKVHQ
jgi:hypothetical protein